jgi:hypothetical protein
MAETSLSEFLDEATGTWARIFVDTSDPDRIQLEITGQDFTVEAAQGVPTHVTIAIPRSLARRLGLPVGPSAS